MISLSSFCQGLPDDITNPHVFWSHHLCQLVIQNKSVRGLAGEPGAFAMHLHPTLSHILFPPQLPLTVPARVSVPYKTLRLAFKSIHHFCEWDLPAERVNNFLQRNREAYRMKDLLTSISILSVSDGTRECQWWMLGLTASVDNLLSEGFKDPKSVFFFLHYLLLSTGTRLSESSLKKSCQFSCVFQSISLPLKSKKTSDHTFTTAWTHSSVHRNSSLTLVSMCELVSCYLELI